MKLREIVNILKAKKLTADKNDDLDISEACGSDLMSDVMAFVRGNVALLTGLVNPQVIRTAEMMDIKLVIFVRGKNPSQDIVGLAEEKGIILLTTEYSMYMACGKLYQAGVRGRGAEA